MNRNSNGKARQTWAWSRWIVSAQRELWTERLQAANAPASVFIERTDRSRILVETYTEDRAVVRFLVRHFGGKQRIVKPTEWLHPPSPPLRIGRRLEIIHEKAKARSAIPRLHVPHGIAFGSGDHGTTHMLLGALTRHSNLSESNLLDLGTGSGVLALTARRFGARKIVATDFDAGAIRTARENEALNFSEPLIRWQCADVKRLRSKTRYDLVVANLFSAILCQAAVQISQSVKAGGQLWLSGILRSQQKEVIATYRKQELRLDQSMTRGKWVLLQWTKP